LCAYAPSLGGDNVGCWSRAIVLPNEPGAAAALAAGLREVDVDGLARLEDEALLIEPLRQAVQDALYWQPPWEYEALLVEDKVLVALAPIAEALVAAPAAQWWFTEMDAENQFGRAFIYDGREVTTPVHDSDARTRPPAGCQPLQAWGLGAHHGPQRPLGDARLDVRGAGVGRGPPHGRRLPVGGHARAGAR
jgi:hypothetical protein